MLHGFSSVTRGAVSSIAHCSQPNDFQFGPQSQMDRSKNQSSSLYSTTNHLFKLEEFFGIDIICDQTIYQPGDRVTGKVYFNLRKKLYCDNIILQLIGEAKVSWTERMDKNSRISTRHEQTKDLVAANVVLWKDGSERRSSTTLDDILKRSSANYIRRNTHTPVSSVERPGLETGRRQMSFSFNLPKEGLMTSFDSPNSVAQITYSLELHVENLCQTILRRKTLISVVVPLDLNQIPQARQPIDREEFFQIERSERIGVRVQVPRTGFCPGEVVQVAISIQNGSSKSIKYATTNILQQHDCFVNSPQFASRRGTYETPGVPMQIDKIPKGSSAVLNTGGRLRVPSLVPAFEIPKFITMDYRLHIVLGFAKGNGKHAFGIVQIPIIIGTVPFVDTLADPLAGAFLYDHSAFASSVSENKNVIPPIPNVPLPSAPPAFDSIDSRHEYEEIPNDPPPSYVSNTECSLTEKL